MISENLLDPVITLDGGAGVGKGTVRKLVAKELGFHELDSGVLYRALAIAIGAQNCFIDSQKWADIASTMQVRMEGDKVWLNDHDISTTVVDDSIGRMASKISADGGVRTALRAAQLAMRKSPGLVADGRDQGYIFSGACRFFLVATPEVCAARRAKQLNQMNRCADFQQILESIKERDHADQTRIINPLRPHPQAEIIDTTNISAEEVAGQVLYLYRNSF